MVPDDTNIPHCHVTNTAKNILIQTEFQKIYLRQETGKLNN